MKIRTFADPFHDLLFEELLSESTTAPPKRILICGNSQAGNGGTGQALEILLKKNGWYADRFFQNGMDTNGLLQKLQSFAPARNIAFAYDAAIFFSGGANGSANIQQDSVSRILSLFPQKTIKFWMGVSPRTKDEKGNFDQSSAVLREKSNSLLGAFVSRLCVFIDWKNLGLQGEETPIGVSFPRLYDGIHLTGSTANAAAIGIWEHMQTAMKQAMNVKQDIPFKASVKPVEGRIEKNKAEVPMENFGDPDEEFALSDEQEEYSFEEEGDSDFAVNASESGERIPYSGGNENVAETIANHQKEKKKKGRSSRIIISEAVYNAIMSASKKFDVPSETLFAIACYESGFNPNVRSSHSSASGLFQFLKSSASGFDRMDPIASAEAAAKILKTNLAIAKSFGQGDWFAYMCHQQGQAGAKNIWNNAVEMKPLLSKTIISNVANNLGIPKEKKALIFQEKNAEMRWNLLCSFVKEKYPESVKENADVLLFFVSRLKRRYEGIKSISNASIQRYNERTR